MVRLYEGEMQIKGRAVQGDSIQEGRKGRRESGGGMDVLWSVECGVCGMWFRFLVEMLQMIRVLGFLVGL